jgi:hypothetical protein
MLEEFVPLIHDTLATIRVFTLKDMYMVKDKISKFPGCIYL